MNMYFLAGGFLSLLSSITLGKRSLRKSKSSSWQAGWSRDGVIVKNLENPGYGAAGRHGVTKAPRAEEANQCSPGGI